MNNEPEELEIINRLRSEHIDLDSFFMERWNRSLPLAELIGDRWERAKRLGFGENSSIYDSSIVFGDVKVGENTWIGPYTILDGSGGLEIGSFCSISAGVQIYSHDSVLWALSGGESQYEREKVVIGDRCYIGPNSVISRGVHIGNGSVVGAMSFVKEDVPEGRLAVGIPAKVKGYVFIKDGKLIMQSRAEQSRAEQSRAEQSRAEQSRAEQSRAEQ
ncbi:MAG: acyltransferase, partial [Synergistaceae bacterium]|nr:acyltransferase [Synergistaceae bacterium]